MGIQINGINIKEVNLGEQGIKEVYSGSNLVFGKEDEDTLYFYYNKCYIVPEGCTTIINNTEYAYTYRYNKGNPNVDLVINTNRQITLQSGEQWKPTLYIKTGSSLGNFNGNSGLGQSTQIDYFKSNIAALQSPAAYLQFSYDKKKWIDYFNEWYNNNNYSGIPINYGQKVYVRSYKPMTEGYWIISPDVIEGRGSGNMIHYSWIENYTTETKSGDDFPMVKVGGDITSLCGNWESLYSYKNNVPGSIYHQYNLTQQAGLFSGLCGWLYDASRLNLSFEDIKNIEGRAASGCYAYMFKGCNNLQHGPRINSKIISVESAMEGMFAQCTSLLEMPDLPAQLVDDEINSTTPTAAYRYMFSECKKLTSLKNKILPSKYLSESCYEGMFELCSNIVNVDWHFLPSYDLRARCYHDMFYGCISLKNTPVLLGIDLWDGAKNLTDAQTNMFFNCPNLELSDIRGQILRNNMGTIFSNSDKLRVFSEFDTTNKNKLGSSSSAILKLYTNGAIAGDIDLQTEQGYLVFLNNDEDFGVGYIHWGEGVVFDALIGLQYSLDYGNTWQRFYDSSEEYHKVHFNRGDVVFVKNTDNKIMYGRGKSEYVFTFIMEGEHIVALGDIKALDYNLHSGDVGYIGCMSGIFCECNGLEIAPGCSYTGSLHYEHMFTWMFFGCKNLKLGMDVFLNNNTTKTLLHQYTSMYNGCQSLEYGTLLPKYIEIGGDGLDSNEEYDFCFESMYNGCSNLKYLTQRQEYQFISQSMFNSTIPNSLFSSMFKDCLELLDTISMSDGNFTQSDSCRWMYKGCSKIKKVYFSPTIVDGTNTLAEMFKYCSSLEEIDMGNFRGAISGVQYINNSFNNWVQGVAPQGVFKYRGTDTGRGTSAIPENWTILSK